jgi:hypothetical protein
MKPPKPCKICPANRYANLSWCFKHWKERERAKRQDREARALTRKQGTKKYQESMLKTWHNKTWKLMSEFVRRMGADANGMNKCFTCDAVKHWKELQAGHRHHRKLNYDLRNIWCQCARCNGKQSNGGLSGNLGEYENRLIRKFGLAWADKLKLDANTAPPYTITEVMAINADLTAKLDEINKALTS